MHSKSNFFLEVLPSGEGGGWTLPVTFIIVELHKVSRLMSLADRAPVFSLCPFSCNDVLSARGTTIGKCVKAEGNNVRAPTKPSPAKERWRGPVCAFGGPAKATGTVRVFISNRPPTSDANY